MVQGKRNDWRAIYPLVERARAGDGEALADLLDKYRPLLAQYTRVATLVDPAVSQEDLAQEVATAFVELVKDYEPTAGTTFGGYLKTHLAWRVHNWMRRVWSADRRQSLDGILLDRLETDDIGVEPTAFRSPALPRSPNSHPTEVLLDSPDPDVVLQLHQALRQLSPKQRQVIFLRYWLDLPSSDIAARLGLSIRAVDRLRQRAEHKIREVCQD